MQPLKEAKPVISEFNFMIITDWGCTHYDYHCDLLISEWRKPNSYIFVQTGSRSNLKRKAVPLWDYE